MLYNYFYQRANQWRNRTALSFSGHTLTFAALFSASETLAASLERSGVTADDIVIVALPNGIDFVCSVLALWMLGAVAALASPKYGADEIEQISQNLPFTHAITDSNSQQVWGSEKNERKKLTDSLILVIRQSHTAQPIKIPDLAVIKFSSGTTGIPKGIALTAGNIISETEGIIDGLHLTTEDRILVTTPLCHSYGFDVGFLASLGSGAMLYIRDMFIPRLTLKEIDSEAITVFLGVPSMYRLWCETRITEQPSLQSLRYLLSCTAPLSPSLLTRFQERFGATICQHYGSTETGAVTTHNPSKVKEKPYSVGQPMPHVTIRIVNDDGATAPDGMEGEVVVSGTAISPGYVMGAPTGGVSLGNGEFRTGDIGFLDADGYLAITGRMDDYINVGGFKVSPLEVAQVLETHPAVKEAAVSGRTDATGESWVYAVVTLQNPVHENELLAFCRNHLAEYKVPRTIEISKELPFSAAGKTHQQQ